MLVTDSPPKLRNPQYQSKQEIKDLTIQSKKLYSAFNTFELEMSRYIKFEQFNEIVEEIKLFNDELDKWKKNQCKIANIVTTYHLYENVFSRLRYISNLARNETDAKQAALEANHWFQTEKPKIRNQVKQVKASMKSATPNKNEDNSIQRTIETNSLKRQMQPYQMMSRTAHPGIFPPKEELKEFKRKLFLPYSDETQEQLTAKKNSSTSALHRSKLTKYRNSITTVMGTTASTNFRKTTNNFKNISEFKPEENQQINEDQKEGEEGVHQPKQSISQQHLEEIEREKKVLQDQAMQETLVKELHEDDEEEDQPIFEEETKGLQIYIQDHNKQDIEIMEEETKQPVHSSMRRVMRINEDKIRSKMEELDIKRNMMTWGKVKSKSNREESRKLETMLHHNKYKQLEFKKSNPEDKLFSSTTGFQNKNKVKTVQIPTIQRSQSSHALPIEKDLENFKIKKMMQTYAKYINRHIPLVQNTTDLLKEQDENKEQSTDIQSMTLTSFARRGKKPGFSNTMTLINSDAYNQNALNEVIKIKTGLASKSLSIDKGTLFRGMSIQPKQNIITNGMHKSGKDLPSNPFFPKTFGSKKKKKTTK